MRDPTDFALVNGWQRGFPLSARPFGDIADRMSLSELAVIEKYKGLQASGVIDRIGPVFRPGAVGASSLAAMAVPPRRLEAVARLVSAQPGVNHNYEREHRYNLWFVVTGATAAEVEASLARIEAAAGLPALRLPLVEEFHIDLGFDLEDHAVPRPGAGEARFPPLSADERGLVGETSRGFPLVAQPYRDIGARLDMTEAQVIGALGRMLADGRIRRIGAVVRHRRVGYEANAMVVWDLPDDRVAEIGRAIARDAAVTLCYRRARALPDWPYNLYCMIHGRERSRVLHEVKRIGSLYGAGRFPGAVLFSRRCFAQRAANYG